MLLSRLKKAGMEALRLPFLSSIVALIVIGFVAVSFERQVTQSHAQNLRIQILNQANQLRSRLESQISQNILATQGLVAVISFRPNITQDEFSLLGENLVLNNRQIRNLAAAPDLVITMMHPVEGNEAALGLDYRNSPAQLGAVELARDTGTIILAGPVDLVQGGQGIVGRLPVFTRDADGERVFWGIVSTVIDTETLYHDAGLTHPDLQIDIAISGRDGNPDEGGVFFGDPDLVNQDPVEVDVVLPYGSWRISAIPEGGWNARPVNWKMRGLFAVTVLLVAGPIVGATILLDARQSYHVRLREGEQERARLSQRLELALAASNLGVWDADLERGGTYWDATARQIYGYRDAGEITSDEDFERVVHPDDLENVKKTVRDAIENGTRVHVRYRLQIGGEIRHVTSAASIQFRDGKPIRMVGVIWDVTDDIRRQEELNARTMQAEAATVAKSQFLATMSHEIRTPMSGILGMLDLLSQEDLNALQRNRVDIAQDSARNLLTILNDILDFSKIEANGIQLEEVSTDIRQLAQDVTKLMTASAGQKGLRLTCTVERDVPDFLVLDPIRYRQIISNLVNNAVKFTASGKVEVFLECSGFGDGPERQLICRVRDTGMGIPKDQTENIFGKFYQTDSSASRRSGGTGLGLAISRQLVELMGGRISVSSRPHEGSTFTFFIRTRVGEARHREAPAAQEAAFDAGDGLRVLVAEDNTTNQYLIEAYLRAGNHEVTMVNNGREAVDAVREGEFDVVLMDIHMPEMDGPEATGTIRGLDTPMATVPIVALTANAIQGDREKYLAAGMNDYLTKPIDRHALMTTIRRVAAGRGRGSDTRRNRAIGF